MTQIELTTARRLRTIQVTPAGGRLLPIQELHLCADGKRLFFRAAPDRPELVSTGNGGIVYVVDTDTLQLIAEVQLPVTAFHLAPTPDGHYVLPVSNNLLDRSQYGTRLIDVSSGRQVAFWPSVVAGPQVVNANP